MKLEIIDICKSFSSKQILYNVSFSVSSGKAMGFLGRNGAGKTTTIRSLMKVFEQDSGEFLLDGKPLDVKKVKIGYLPEERGMYGKEKILDQLIYFARLKGATHKEAKESAEYWLERFELTYAKHHRLDTLSKGNQQKVQIAQALLNNPDLYIFDEPFSGLDPVNSQVLKDVISEKIQEGKLVIFSSHQMSYVEEFCDEIALIDHGKIILSGSLNQIKEIMGEGKIRIQFKGTSFQESLDWMKQHLPALECEVDRQSLIVNLNGLSSKEFLKQCTHLNADVEFFAPYRPTLHDIFVKKVGEDHA